MRKIFQTLAISAVLLGSAQAASAQITFGIVGTGILLSTCVGLAAGFLPAFRASNLPVIDALRAE